jgi:hypothetical protein
MSPHPGVRFDDIPAAGGGGMILALGTIVLFWLGVPEFRPVVLASLAGGLLFAPLFHRLGH